MGKQSHFNTAQNALVYAKIALGGAVGDNAYNDNLLRMKNYHDELVPHKLSSCQHSRAAATVDDEGGWVGCR